MENYIKIWKTELCLLNERLMHFHKHIERSANRNFSNALFWALEYAKTDYKPLEKKQIFINLCGPLDALREITYIVDILPWTYTFESVSKIRPYFDKLQDLNKCRVEVLETIISGEWDKEYTMDAVNAFIELKLYFEEIE